MEKTSVVLFRYIFFFEHVAKHVRNVNKHTFMLRTQIMSMILVSLRRHRAYRGQSALSAWWRNSGERRARLLQIHSYWSRPNEGDYDTVKHHVKSLAVTPLGGNLLEWGGWSVHGQLQVC